MYCEDFQVNLPAVVLSLNLLQEVQTGEVQSEHKEVSKRPTCVQMRQTVATEAAVTEPSKSVDLACSQ